MIHWEEPAPHVGLAILDRPERRNALNAEQCDALRGHLEANHHLRAIVFAGRGHVVLRRRRHRAPHRRAHRASRTARRTRSGPAFELLCDEIEHHPAPIIAAVHGPAIGAGTQLVVACDFRVAGPDAVFGIPASKLGIVLSPANVRRLVQLVGHHNAKDLLVTSRYVDRDEANRLGLVTRYVDHARGGAIAFASEIAALAPITVQGHKRAVNLVQRGRRARRRRGRRGARPGAAGVPQRRPPGGPRRVRGEADRELRRPLTPAGQPRRSASSFSDRPRAVGRVAHHGPRPAGRPARATTGTRCRRRIPRATSRRRPARARSRGRSAGRRRSRRSGPGSSRPAVAGVTISPASSARQNRSTSASVVASPPSPAPTTGRCSTFVPPVVRGSRPRGRASGVSERWNPVAVRPAGVSTSSSSSAANGTMLTRSAMSASST